MCDPGTVERNKAASVDSAGKDVFGDEYTFIPEKDLVAAAVRVREVFALSDALEPVIVGVRTVGTLEPFVDEHVCRVVVELLAHKLAHGETRRDELGVVPPGHGGRRSENRVVVGRDGEGAGELEGVVVEVGVESEGRG